MEIQHFRLSGTTEIHGIVCSRIKDRNLVFWEDIEELFPEIQYLKHGDVLVTRLRDSDGRR